VLLGAAASERSFRRIVEYADGWLPAFVTRDSIETAPQYLDESRRLLDQLAVDAGRDPTTIQITAILRGPTVNRDVDAAQRVDRALVARLADVGVDRVAISMSTITSDGEARDHLTRIADTIL
jgi:alkanesulfonate monooxygenase SsuD/methylene tetrahydromethanopterin reductase-like flavin-dependent oxidoreductase (luciferase family)